MKKSQRVFSFIKEIILRRQSVVVDVSASCSNSLKCLTFPEGRGVVVKVTESLSVTLTTTPRPSKPIQFIGRLKDIIDQSLVKFRPLVCKISANRTHATNGHTYGRTTGKHNASAAPIGDGWRHKNSLNLQKLIIIRESGSKYFLEFSPPNDIFTTALG